MRWCGSCSATFPRQFDFITGQLDSFQTAPVSFGAGGMLMLVWASLGVFNALTSAVNHAWGVEKRRSFLKHRLVVVPDAGVGRRRAAARPDPGQRRPARREQPVRRRSCSSRRGWRGPSGVTGHYAATRAADPVRGAGLLLHPQHQGALPRRVAGRRSGRASCGASRSRCSPGTPATWPAGTSSTARLPRSWCSCSGST